MWFTSAEKKRLQEAIRIQSEMIANLQTVLDEAMSTVKLITPHMDEAAELRDRVAFQEKIDECLRLELKLVKDRLLLRDVQPDVPALMRLYSLDDPRS